jgi:ketosteroid isomerase-like protein
MAGEHMRAVGLLGFCFLGCVTSTASISSSSARTAIEEGNRLLVASALVGNGNRVATVFANDATILPFRQPGTIHGHVAIAEYWRDVLASTKFLELELSTSEVNVSGDLAYEIGTTRVKTQTGDAAPVASTGRYLAVWRFGSDGTWRIQVYSTVPDPAKR